MSNWFDTVMSQAETTKVIDKGLNGEIEARHVSRAIAERQAEVSFKAGMMKVVEWVENRERHYSNPHFKFDPKWRAFLKENGLEQKV